MGINRWPDIGVYKVDRAHSQVSYFTFYPYYFDN